MYSSLKTFYRIPLKIILFKVSCLGLRGRQDAGQMLGGNISIPPVLLFCLMQVANSYSPLAPTHSPCWLKAGDLGF